MVKLVIGGSTGFVGTELIRQALANPAITSVIALSRRPTSVPDDAPNGHKLRSIVVADFVNYDDGIKAELADADACIWTIAVTPTKAKETPWNDIVVICRDYALTAIKAVAAAPQKQSRPVRFLYISGHFTLRKGDEVDAQLKAYGLVDLALMRGELEDSIIDFGRDSDGRVESLVVKPGFIASEGRNPPLVPGLPSVQLREIAAALLDQALGGFESHTLSNSDLVRIGRGALGEEVQGQLDH